MTNAPAIPSYTVRNRRDQGRSNISPRASDEIYNHSGTSADGMRLRVTVPAESAGTKRAITKFDWEKSLNLSRQLYGRLGEVSGAIQQKSLYVVGKAWCPKYAGKDQEWGNLAEEWLEYWLPQCNYRGEPFDFLTSLFLDSIAYDRDGDSAMLTIIEDGQPKIEFIPAHQVCFRYGTIATEQDGTGIVATGPYKGARGYNGVIFDRKGKVIAYNILGRVPEEDRQISISSCQLLYEPEWADQGRGIPKLATCLPHWMDYEDLNYFLKRQVKQDSAQGILHYNEEGAAEDTKDFIEGKSSGAPNQDVKIERLEGNEIMYFKAMGGGKIEPYKSDRPSPNVEAFKKGILRGNYLAINWPIELTDPSGLVGAATRLIQDQARASIGNRQGTIYKRAMRIIQFGLAVAMENGDVPENDDPEWLRKWDFTLPGLITVDARYEDQTYMDRIKMGAGTYAEYYGSRSQWWEDGVRQRVREQKFIEAECAKEGVDPDKIQILIPNGNPQPAEPSTGQDAAKDGEKAK